MGCKLSRETEPPPPPLPSPTTTTSHNLPPTIDSNLRSFDSAVHHRTTSVINSLAAGLSLDSLKEATEGLLDLDLQVVNVILECKKDIWKNKHLFDLVNDYFINSLETLDYCAALNSCLTRVRDREFVINVAVQQFEEEKRDGSTLFSRTLQELNKFQVLPDPFGDDFFTLFQSVYKKQLVMLNKLQCVKTDLNEKLTSMKKWRRLSNVLFVATFAAVLICSVVAAAVSAPPVLAALAAAAAVPLGSVGKWIDSIWSKYESEMKGEKEFVGAMEVGSFIVVKDLENVRLVIDKLHVEIEGLLRNAEFANREEEAVGVAINDIKTKLSGFVRTIEDLSKYADNCSRDIRRARTVVLHKMIKHPSS